MTTGEKVDTIYNIVLSIAAGISYKFSLEAADQIIVYALHFLSFISVAMLIVINGDKTVKIIRKWKENKKDNKNDKIKD